MEYTVLAGTGLHISTLGMGTMVFGSQTEGIEAVHIMHEAIDAGINFIDTANVYANGESERIVGHALQGHRDDVILATKGGGLMSNQLNNSGLSRTHLLRAAEDSLRRLRTDYVDLYYLHMPDHITPFEEMLETADSLIRAGKARYVGISNFPAWEVQKMRGLCQQHGWIAPVCMQVVYNLLTRDIERELLPFARDAGMGVIVYNPLAGGLLSGKYMEKQLLSHTRFSIGDQLSSIYRNRFWNDQNLSLVDQLDAIAKEAGISLLEMALRWCLNQHDVSAMLLGVSTRSQLAQNLQAIRGGALSEDTLQACNHMWEELTGNRMKYYR